MRALARRLDLSPTYLSQIETGKLPPLSAEHIRDAAVFIGCDAIELLRAAMDDRWTVELDASLGPAHRGAATALAMNWPALTEEQLLKIAAIANGDDR